MTTQTVRDRILTLIKLLADDTKSRLAEMLGINPANIHDWVNRDRIPGGEHLQTFHDKLNVNINWLLTGEGEMFVSRVGYAHQKESVPIVLEPLAQYGYDKEEREYMDKLVTIIRTKQDKTVIAIKQNIDAFLDNPDKAKEPVKKTKAG